jgi:hypothetical protein
MCMRLLRACGQPRSQSRSRFELEGKLHAYAYVNDHELLVKKDENCRVGIEGGECDLWEQLACICINLKIASQSWDDGHGLGRSPMGHLHPLAPLESH